MKPRAPRTSSRPRCGSGKVRYRDELEAGAVIAAARRSGKTYIPQRSYDCRECGGVHLTSKPLRGQLPELRSGREDEYPFHARGSSGLIAADDGSDEARMRAMLEWTPAYDGSGQR